MGMPAGIFSSLFIGTQGIIKKKKKNILPQQWPHIAISYRRDIRQPITNETIGKLITIVSHELIENSLRSARPH
jgi:hypothetical protein